jgi:hypothetical protein
MPDEKLREQYEEYRQYSALREGEAAGSLDASILGPGVERITEPIQVTRVPPMGIH